MDGKESRPESDEHSMISIDSRKILSLINRFNDSEFLEIKRTTKAKVMRFDIPSTLEDYLPIAVLPGSSQKFSVKIDNNSNYHFTSHSDSSISEVIYAPQNQKDRKINKSLTKENGERLLYSIWLTQKYLQGVEQRLNDEIKNGQKLHHILVPHDLYSTVIAIEGVFDNDGEYAIEELHTGTNDLSTYLNNRVIDFKKEMETLSGYLSIPNNPPDNTPVTKIPDKVGKDTDKILLPEKNWEEHRSLEYFIGDCGPNEFNREHVISVIDNLLDDFLLPKGWVTEKSVPRVSKEIFKLKLTLNESEIDYNAVLEQLDPVEKALANDIGTNPDLNQTAKTDCENIRKLCNQPFTVEKIIKYSPKSLKSRINNIIHKNGLTELMSEEIRNSFEGLFNKLTNNGKNKLDPKTLEEIFLEINNIKYGYDKALEFYGIARKFMKEHSTTKDTERVRQEAEADISKAIRNIRREMMTESDKETLKKSSKKSQFDATDLLEEIKYRISANASDESVFWIGLGQAGGQILRECLLYCLNNLSDARCRALITALGAKPQDLRDILHNVKNIYSSKSDIKTAAEQSLEKIFDNKMHLLAINLGEEVDELAKFDQPGYFLWGSKQKSDSTSRTVRTTRNILKLKPKGEGAGGETGVGRAYGFRFRQDITDVMRDVGKKGNSSPKHIVITHSLAGGSGSGMVLPVLQQARRTFGQDAVIWVVSVGEGASESRSVAKINTPFIISDILQATYEGIHAIHEPIEFSDWRSFIREISTASKAMEESANSLIMELSDNSGDGELLKQLNLILKGGHRGKFVDNSGRWTDKYGKLKDIGKSPELDSLNMSKLIDSELKSSIIKNQFKKSVDALCNILPDSKDQSIKFTSWCKERVPGGFKPASDFWMTWLDCIYDPLSMFLEGKTKQHQTVADEAGDGGKEYFTPNLTGNHLKSVMDTVLFEEDIENEYGQSVKNSDISPGMVPLQEAILNRIAKFEPKEEKQKRLFQIKKHLEDYGHALNKINTAKEKMTVHIQSLSGSAGDLLVKLIVVSNSHLEKGIISTNNLESSGKAYTVYNSVIFDLMLNIIGTRLPSEAGAFVMDEKIDHMDMVKSTNPPLVVGLLNHRDSASLTEPPERIGDVKIDPDDVSTLFNSMFTQPYANPGGLNELSNPMFLEKREMGAKLQALFLSIFGSRYKYMLQVNPYDTINSNYLDDTELNSYCEKLVKVWDDRDEKIFDVEPNNRELLVKVNGISGLHISNLVKWISLIETESLSRFIGTPRSQLELCSLMKGDGKLWGMVRKGEDAEFDIGVLRIDSSIQRFIGKDSERNREHLNNSLPKMGIHNAEILRSIGSAYLNSFLPIELLHSIDEIDTSVFDYKSFGFSEKSFCEEIDKTIGMSPGEFSILLFEVLKENHTLSIDGTIDDPDNEVEELLELLETEMNCVLDYFDLQLISDDSKYRLRLHPRLNRYFSAVRDIPSKADDKLLPVRNASASLSRYLHADSLNKPLDADYNPRNRNGIASPTFTLGGHILNQMRYIGLLPDEKRLSLIPLLRILLLGIEDRIVLKKRLGYQFASMGIDFEGLSPHFDRILGVKYDKTEIFNEPAIYANLVSTFVKRLHESKTLLLELSSNPPEGWNNFDIDAIGFMLESVLQEEDLMPEDIDAVEKLYGNNVESIPDVRTWLQDVYEMVSRSKEAKQKVGGNATDLESSNETSDVEDIATVSNESPSIVSLKQLFYDVAYNINEALGQAIYLDQEDKASRSVHFEMTGFSDRLIGKPKGLLILVHDRNPKLPMDVVQSSIRESVNYNFGLQLGSPKAFNTAADYGPTSFLTVVLQNAPAADISDQFQKLVHDESEGLSGNNPFWAFENSKLHPYILLYNLLWLSANINKWIDPGNKEYIRRFQIPTSIIEHHYCNPEKLDNDRIRLEKEKQSFPGDINMPEDDTRDFNTALSGDLSGIRNIVKLIGIMSLRYEKAAGIIDKKVWKDCGLSEEDYEELRVRWSSDAEMLTKEHLFKEEKKKEKKKENRFFKKKKKDVVDDKMPEDTIKTRAIAWFKAYAAWKNYSKQPSANIRNDDASKFEAQLGSSDE
jgi:hypothetical protein